MNQLKFEKVITPSQTNAVSPKCVNAITSVIDMKPDSFSADTSFSAVLTLCASVAATQTEKEKTQSWLLTPFF